MVPLLTKVASGYTSESVHVYNMYINIIICKTYDTRRELTMVGLRAVASAVGVPPGDDRAVRLHRSKSGVGGCHPTDLCTFRRNGLQAYPRKRRSTNAMEGAWMRQGCKDEGIAFSGRTFWVQSTMIPVRPSLKPIDRFANPPHDLVLCLVVLFADFRYVFYFRVCYSMFMYFPYLFFSVCLSFFPHLLYVFRCFCLSLCVLSFCIYQCLSLFTYIFCHCCFSFLFILPLLLCSFLLSFVLYFLLCFLLSLFMLLFIYVSLLMCFYYSVPSLFLFLSLF